MSSKGAGGHFLMMLKDVDRQIEMWIRNFIEEIEEKQTNNINQKG